MTQGTFASGSESAVAPESAAESAYAGPSDGPKDEIEELIEETVLIEEISIDGMCGVY
jgi:mycofactocin precursor